MEHRASAVDDSISEPFPESKGHSEAGSLIESVGSAEIASWMPKPKPKPKKNRPTRKTSKVGTQILHCVKELRGVPVSVAWAFIRNHRALAGLIPGMIESFHQLEGQGDTGSVYIVNYSPKCVKPGDDTYIINKVEVSDDDSKLHVMKRVGGRYQTWYRIYVTSAQVLADAVLGDRSSVVVWSLEYEIRIPDSNDPPPRDNFPPHECSKKSYMICLDMIRERYLSINTIDRPIQVKMTKRLKLELRAERQRLPLIGAADVPGPEVSSQKLQRRRKPRIAKNDEENDRKKKSRIAKKDDNSDREKQSRIAKNDEERNREKKSTIAKNDEDSNPERKSRIAKSDEQSDRESKATQRARRTRARVLRG